MSKNEAIRGASQEVSCLFKFGDGWKYSYFDKGVNSWRESQSQDYYSARSSRRKCLIDIAIRKLNPHLEDSIYVDEHDIEGLSWKKCVVIL